MKHSHNFIDLTGQKFGRLLVINITSKNKRGSVKWLCLCNCGNVIKVMGGDLKNGHTQSCGCLQKEITSKIKTIHGLTNTSEYKIWISMKTRCFNKNHKSYNYYGGRGITICNEWKNSFENFYKDMGDRPKGLTLDRINNNLGYSKENCRWTTHTEQNRNKRNNVIITYNGETLCLKEWVKKTGIHYKLLWARLNKGWSVEKAFTK